jgi:hypothetical protein
MPPLPGPALQPVERHIPGPPGAPEVRLWVVDLAPAEKRKPVLRHMHGGGFMMPDPVAAPTAGATTFLDESQLLIFGGRQGRNDDVNSCTLQ